MIVIGVIMVRKFDPESTGFSESRYLPAYMERKDVYGSVEAMEAAHLVRQVLGHVYRSEIARDPRRGECMDVDVLYLRFGLDGEELSCQQVADEVGISKIRVE